MDSQRTSLVGGFSMPREVMLQMPRITRSENDDDSQSLVLTFLCSVLFPASGAINKTPEIADSKIAEWSRRDASKILAALEDLAARCVIIREEQPSGGFCYQLLYGNWATLPEMSR